ncbi:MAG: hypothetical protein GC202_14290 [Alphaproteobacteria bacterium]|nr:hypothetical protein [Alphaproteobacteria bacterium]
MKSFDATTLARLQAGEVDYIDAVTFFFDSGAVSLFFGGVGSFDWSDATLGAQTFVGGGALLSIELPEQKLGAEAQPITIKLAETYLTEGSDTPVNVFDDGVRAEIDEEEWEGRTAILSCFWRAADGSIIEREQIDVRQINRVHREIDEAGNPLLIATLELPDIIQRDIEGKTQNADLQAMIDATDLGFEHAAETVTQKIYFGRATPKSVT